jgi:hypothetical protein
MEADMKVIRVGQRCLLAALALSAIACASASASSIYEVRGLPEIGRCVKVGIAKGVYRGAQCITVEKKGLGAYEWTQVNATEKFTFAGSGLESILTTTGLPKIKCIAANATGEWTGGKTASVTIEFQGCTNALGKQCQSGPVNKSEIKTLPLEGELGFIRNELVEGKLIVVVGLDLKPQPPLTDLAIYECGSATETSKLEGSVIGKIQPINKMTLESNLLYTTKSNGEQLYKKFQGGPEDVLSTTFTSGVTSTTAPTTLKIKTETGKNSAPLEIKAKEN